MNSCLTLAAECTAYPVAMETNYDTLETPREHVKVSVTPPASPPRSQSDDDIAFVRVSDSELSPAEPSSYLPFRLPTNQADDSVSVGTLDTTIFQSNESKDGMSVFTAAQEVSLSQLNHP
jgi:hypothetical protein